MLKIVTLDEMTEADLIEVIGKTALIRVEDRKALELRPEGVDPLEFVTSAKVLSIQRSVDPDTALVTYLEGPQSHADMAWPNDLKQATFIWETTQNLDRSIGHFGA